MTKDMAEALTTVVAEDPKTTEADKVEVAATPATVTIPAEKIQQAIEGRLTTLETETDTGEHYTVPERIAKLIDVKSFVTLSLTIAFIYASLSGKVPQELNNVYGIVIAFYFSTQALKAKSEK